MGNHLGCKGLPLEGLGKFIERGGHSLLTPQNCRGVVGANFWMVITQRGVVWGKHHGRGATPPPKGGKALGSHLFTFI